MPPGCLLNIPPAPHLEHLVFLVTFFIAILFELGKSVLHFCLLDRTQKICWLFLLWEAFSTPTPSYDSSYLKPTSPLFERSWVMLARATLPLTALLLYY